jgi:molecular chaperone GrpE
MNPSDTELNTNKNTDDSASEQVVDEVVYEESPDLEAGDDPMEDGAAALAKIKDLRAKLAASEKEKMEYLSGWQRAKADMVNANRRHDEERARFSKMAQDDLIIEILPALDGFDMAMGNKESWEKVDAAWRVGVEYIRTQLTSALSRVGVEAVRPLGQSFDPAKHDSVGTVAGKEGEVIEVLQAGYVRGDVVIRPAIVKTGDGSVTA